MLAALVDGNSERAVERMTDVERKTIRRFALTLGTGAQRLHDRLVRDMVCSMVEVDEIWAYVGKKQARVDPAKDGPDVGEAYTFVALDVSSRLVISFHVGKRDQASTDVFMEDVRARLVVMPAMTSDGFTPYVPAIGKSFGPSIDYAQTIKNYRSGARRGPDHRYEPPRDPFITKKAIFGNPDLGRASTAYIERHNGTMRHHIGRIRRLCYAFSKKIENHRAAIALCYAHYNFCHVVKTLRVTPAMAAGVTDHIWELGEFMAAVLAEAPSTKPVPRALIHTAPAVTARELPNGRGFLRVVGGGSGASRPLPVPLPVPVPPAVPVAQVAMPSAAAVADTTEQLLVDNKSGASRSSPDPATDPIPPAPAAQVATLSAVTVADTKEQLDLLSWMPPALKPRAPRVQLDLFGLDIDPLDDRRK